MVLAAPLMASAQTAAFEKASELPDVKYIYLSKSMLSQLGDNDSIDNLSFNLGDITKRLNSLEVLSTNDNLSVEATVPMLKEMAQKMDLISQVKNGTGADVNVYGKKEKGKDVYSKLMCLYQVQLDLLVAVYMTGEIDIDDIKQLMNATTTTY